MNDDQNTAIHEAGHAIASARLGLEIELVSINPHEDSLGHVAGDFNYGPDSNYFASCATVLCAGWAALIVSGCSDVDASIGCDGDFTKVVEIAAGWKLPPIQHWKQEAIKLLSAPENIKAINLLANQLIRHRTVGPNFVATMIEIADGESTIDDLVRYERMGGSTAHLS